MLDLLLGVGLLVALFRGYRTGLLRGALGLVVMVVAILVGYRAGPAGAAFVGSWTGTDPLAARIIGSVVVFLAVLAGGTLAARRSVAILGPLRPVDRIAGAVLSGAWFVVVAVLLLLLAGATPNLPARLRALVSDSHAAGAVLSQGNAVTPVVSRVLGDRLLESFVNINRLAGRGQVVIEGEERVAIPLETSWELADGPEQARVLFENLNLARIEEGVAAVAWSAALAEVAGGHGREMYEDGYFSHVSPVTGTVDERLEARGIPFRVVGENLALSPTVATVHEGLLASSAHRATMLDPRFTRVGVSALEGPLGLMVVQVFSG